MKIVNLRIRLVRKIIFVMLIGITVNLFPICKIPYSGQKEASWLFISKAYLFNNHTGITKKHIYCHFYVTGQIPHQINAFIYKQLTQAPVFKKSLVKKDKILFLRERQLN